MEGVSFVAVYKWIKKDPLGPEHFSYRREGVKQFLAERIEMKGALREFRRYKSFLNRVLLAEREIRRQKKAQLLKQDRTESKRISIGQAIYFINKCIQNPLQMRRSV